MVCSLVASAIRPDIVLLGAKDGKVKVIDIDRGQAGKSLSVCSNAVIEMVVLERSTKPCICSFYLELPIIVCWPCGEECIKIVNTESGKVDSIQAKGMIEFGCGIGPKASFLSGGKNLAVLSQSKERPEVNFFRLDVSWFIILFNTCECIRDLFNLLSLYSLSFFWISQSVRAKNYSKKTLLQMIFINFWTEGQSNGEFP